MGALPGACGSWTRDTTDLTRVEAGVADSLLVLDRATGRGPLSGQASKWIRRRRASLEHMRGRGYLCAGDGRAARTALTASIRSNPWDLRTLFSYPHGQPGDFDEGTKTAVAELGLSCGAAAIGGLNTAASDPLELRRVAVDNRDHLADFIWNMSELRWVSRDVRGKVASH